MMEEDSANKENANSTDTRVAQKRCFSTPVAKLNRSLVRGKRRNVGSKASGANMSTSTIYKQSLKNNNRSLARALDISKQDTAILAKKVLELEQEKQEQAAKISVLRRLTDASSEAIETEIQQRMMLRMERLKRKLEAAANLQSLAADELNEVINLCDHLPVHGLDEVVKDALEFTQMITPSQTTNSHHRSAYPSKNSAEDAELSNPVVLLEDDSYDKDHRLSSVSEAVEAHRRSSILPVESKDDVSVESAADALTATITRSKNRASKLNSRMSRCSITTDSSEAHSSNPESDTHSRRSSRGKGRRSTALGANRLEPVYSAAAVSHSPGEADGPHETEAEVIGELLDGSASDPSVSAPDILTPDLSTSNTDIAAAAVNDSEEVMSVSSAASAQSVPFDEIPVDSAYAKMQHEKELARQEQARQEAMTVTRSRRQTRVIKLGSQDKNETQDLLNEAVEKFFVQFSPPKIFNDQKNPSRSRRQSRRQTFCIKDHSADSVEKEDEFILESDSGASSCDMEEVDGAGGSDKELARDDELEVPTSPELPGSPVAHLPIESSTAHGAPELPGSPVGHLPIESSMPPSTRPDERQVEELPVRQMEIQCKGGEVTVKVGSRDGGPVTTKRRKKCKPSVEQKQLDSRTKDIFDLSLSDTVVDQASSLKEFKEKQKKLAAEVAMMNDESDSSKTTRPIKNKPKRQAATVKADNATTDSESVDSDWSEPKKKKKARQKKLAKGVISNTEPAQSSTDVVETKSGAVPPNTEKKDSVRPSRGRRTKQRVNYKEIDSSMIDATVLSKPVNKNTSARSEKEVTSPSQPIKAEMVVVDIDSDSCISVKERQSSQPTSKLATEELTPIQVNHRRKRAAVMLDSPLAITPLCSRSSAASYLDRTLTNDSKSPLATNNAGSKGDFTAVPIESESASPAALKGSPVRRVRRAAANINFKEPNLVGKLRRGDPGTTNVYGNTEVKKDKKKKTKR